MRKEIFLLSKRFCLPVISDKGDSSAGLSAYLIKNTVINLNGQILNSRQDFEYVERSFSTMYRCSQFCGFNPSRVNWMVKNRNEISSLNFFLVNVYLDRKIIASNFCKRFTGKFQRILENGKALGRTV